MLNVRVVGGGGMAVVEFESRDDAEKAVKLDRTELWGRVLRWKFDGQPYTDRGGPKETAGNDSQKAKKKGSKGKSKGQDSGASNENPE